MSDFNLRRYLLSLHFCFPFLLFGGTEADDTLSLSLLSNFIFYPI
jgi:hypothetical protein